MKVLWLDHPEADYLAAITFRGMCEVLGTDSVVDWVRMPHYHGETYDGPIPYGPGATGKCAPYDWMPAWSGREWSDDEVYACIGEFDFVVLASPRVYGIERMHKLIARVGRASIKKFAMLDGEDYTGIRWDLVRAFSPDVYFKTSLVPNPHEVWAADKLAVHHPPRVVPFPLATTFQKPLFVDKTVDVCFLGGSNWFGTRREGQAEDRAPVKGIIEEEIKKIPGIKFVGGQLPYEQYRPTLAASKIAICVSGHGLEGMRTFEAMSCPDTLVIRETLPQITPWPLIGGETCVTYTSHEQIAGLVEHWFLHEEERRQLALNGFEYVWAHYSSGNRAEQLIAEMA